MVEEKIDLNDLDKSGWKTYCFDEIVQNISERVDPNDTELETYIGLEHLDTRSFSISRFGRREDVKGQKLRFYPGDVIFARRRAYQRKAAVATFDGFCSAHALVLRANSEVIEPDLLPFFMHSDLFMHRAIDISVGSLSPTINWGGLKSQTFQLPPKDNQSDLVKLLQAMKSVSDSSHCTLQRNHILHNSLLKEFEQKIDGTNSSIGDFVEIKNGYAFSGKGISQKESDLILMTPGNFKIGGGFSYEKIKYYHGVDFDSKFIFSEDDLVITMTDLSKEGDTLGSPAFVPAIPNKKILHNQRLGRVSFINFEILPKFLFHILQTNKYRSHILRASTKTTVSHTYPERIKQFKFKCPAKTEQNIWIEKFRAVHENQLSCENKISALDDVTNALINRIF